MIEEMGAITGFVPSGSRSRAGQFLGNDLAIAVNVRCPIEFNPDMESPIPEAERTRSSTPVAPLSKYSIGRVTRISTSSGAIPGASVRMVTVSDSIRGTHPLASDAVGSPVQHHDEGGEQHHHSVLQ